MSALELIELHGSKLRALGARRIGVFGSAARGESRPDSDVDVYVELDDARRTYDAFCSIYELLENAFGRPIDLVTDRALSQSKARLILPTVRYAAIDA